MNYDKRNNYIYQVQYTLYIYIYCTTTLRARNKGATNFPKAGWKRTTSHKIAQVNLAARETWVFLPRLFGFPSSRLDRLRREADIARLASSISSICISGMRETRLFVRVLFTMAVRRKNNGEGAGFNQEHTYLLGKGWRYSWNAERWLSLGGPVFTGDYWCGSYNGNCF